MAWRQLDVHYLGCAAWIVLRSFLPNGTILETSFGARATRQVASSQMDCFHPDHMFASDLCVDLFPGCLSLGRVIHRQASGQWLALLSGSILACPSSRLTNNGRSRAVLDCQCSVYNPYSTY